MHLQSRIAKKAQVAALVLLDDVAHQMRHIACVAPPCIYLCGARNAAYRTFTTGC
jgi:hypothetical protein